MKNSKGREKEHIGYYVAFYGGTIFMSLSSVSYCVLLQVRLYHRNAHKAKTAHVGFCGMQVFRHSGMGEFGEYKLPVKETMYYVYYVCMYMYYEIHSIIHSE